MAGCTLSAIVRLQIRECNMAPTAEARQWDGNRRLIAQRAVRRPFQATTHRTWNEVILGAEWLVPVASFGNSACKQRVLARVANLLG